MAIAEGMLHCILPLLLSAGEAEALIHPLHRAVLSLCIEPLGKLYYPNQVRSKDKDHLLYRGAETPTS